MKLRDQIRGGTAVQPPDLVAALDRLAAAAEADPNAV
jgi:hypothetical protein